MRSKRWPNGSVARNRKDAWSCIKCWTMQGDGIDEKNENENDIIDYLMIIENGHMHDNYSGMRS